MHQDLIDRTFLEYLNKANKADKTTNPKVISVTENKTQSVSRINSINLTNTKSAHQINQSQRSFGDISFDYLERKKRLNRVSKSIEKEEKLKRDVHRTKPDIKRSVADFDDFYNKSVHWKIERDIQNQRIQKELQNQELKTCTFSPKITAVRSSHKKIFLNKESDFISFAHQMPSKKPIEETKNLYSDLFEKRQMLRKTSPIKDQKSYRRVVDIKMKNNELCERIYRKAGPQTKKKYDQKIYELRSYLQNMDY